MVIKSFTVDRRTQYYADQARTAVDNDALVVACRGLDIADHVILDNINLNLAKHTLSAIYNALKKYPKLRTGINYFGTMRGFCDNILRFFLDQEKPQGFVNKVAVKRIANQLINQVTKAFSDQSSFAHAFYFAMNTFFGGIIINETVNELVMMETLVDNEKIGFHPPGCGTLKSLIDHEIGHIFDYLLGLCDLPAMKNYFTFHTPDMIRQNVSRYCIMSGEISWQEVVAEAYSEYQNSPNPRQIAMFIGRLIETRIKALGRR